MRSARARVASILLFLGGAIAVLARMEPRSAISARRPSAPELLPSAVPQVATGPDLDGGGGRGRSPVPPAATTASDPGPATRTPAAGPLSASTIRGSIRFRDGRPAADVVIHAFAEDDSGSASARSRDDGAYELEVEPGPESFDVVISWGDLLVQESGIAPGSRGVDFVLEGKAVVHYRVVDALTRTAYRDFEIRWRRAGEHDWLPLAVTEPRLFETQWWFRAELAEGLADFLVVRHAGNHLPRRIEGVSIREDHDPWLEIELEPGLELELRFDSAAGGFPSGHFLALFERATAPQVPCTNAGPFPRGVYWDVDEVPEGMHALRPTAGGRGAVGGLAAGVYVLRACPDDLAFSPAEILVRGSPGVPIFVTWQPIAATDQGPARAR
jgi:hypothetical protein